MWASTNFFTWDLEDLKSFALSETKNDMDQSKINDHSFIDAKAELERMKKNQAVGIKHDEGKTKFHLLIPEFIKGVADVMTIGAQKYSAWNYLHLDKDRIIDAHCRHMNAYQCGELNDPETGLSHLFHATCCLQMLWALDNDFFGKEEKKCQG